MTPHTTTKFRRFAHLLCARFTIAVVLAGCGGGAGVIGSGGTGSPLGMAVGTVNGFGSVIVDGQAFDDRSAAVVTEVAPGVDAPAEVSLGDRVAVEYETPGVARTVRVEAAVVASIDSVIAPDRFVVLGQLVAVNADGALGPITQFGGGYTRSSDLRAGDPVEVHGLLLHQPGDVQIQATRIEKLAAVPTYLRVSGVAGGLRTGSAPGFDLGQLVIDTSAATVLPAGAALADGQTVMVLGLASKTTSGPMSALTMQAAQVRIGNLDVDSLGDSISGSVAHVDAAARTFMLGTLRVSYAAATLSPGAWTPAEGQYVLVHGKADATGTLIASDVTLRDAGSDSEAELRGNIVGFNAATMRFSVRDVPVDASSAVLDNCPAGGLAEGLYVEVEGSMVSDGVIAKKVHCESEPPDASIEREGVAGSVDTSAQTFSLIVEHGAPVPVHWTDTTYFGGLTPATLAGKKVQVEGSFVGLVLEARKIKSGD